MSRPAGASGLAVLEISVFVSMLGVGIIVPFLPLYARGMGASGLMMGLIFSGFSASRMVAMPYVGVASDRAGRKPFIAAGLAGFSLVALAMVLVESPWQLLSARLAQGLFAAMVLPVSMALVADVTPRGHEGRVFGGFNTAVLLGFGVGPLLGGLVFDAMGVKANFLLMAALSVASLLLVALFVREPAGIERQSQRRGFRAELSLVRDRGLLAVCLSRVGGAMALGCFIAFLPLLAAGKGVSNSEVGVLLAVNVLVMTAVQKPFGALIDRLPRMALAAAGLGLQGLCKAALPLATGFWGLCALVVVEGLAAGMALPALTALAVSQGRRMDAGMGVTMGLFGMALSVGVFVGPILGGLGADLWSVSASFYFAGAAALSGVVVLIALGRGRISEERS